MGTQAESPDINERVRVTKKHLDFSIRWKGDRLGIFEMRRHYASYFKGFPEFKLYRTRLVEVMTAAEVHQILDEVIERYSMVVV
jgi:tRNA-dihydrouridine synthase